MILICYGMQKSASSFAFQLSKEVANTRYNQWELNQILPEELKPAFVANNLFETITKLIEYIHDDQIYVIKTHCALSEEVKELIREGSAKATISVRDPYDIVVSLKDTGETERRKELSKQREYFTKIMSYDDALKYLPPILKNVSSWLEYKKSGMLTIPFSRIAEDPIAVTQDIAQLLGVTVDAAGIVEPYTSSKKPILEFNVGKQGRGRELLNLPECNEIKQSMDQFIKMYL